MSREKSRAMRARSPVFEEKSRLGHYVDLDNVGDDDPDNLFGTVASAKVSLATHSDSDEEWGSRRSNYHSRQDKGDWREGSDSIVKGDLRAKLVGRRNRRKW